MAYVGLSDYNKSYIIGPGMWFSFSQDAHYLETLEDVSALVKRLKRQGRYFPCGECRKHFAETLQEFNIDKLAEDDRQLILAGRQTHYLADFIVEAHTRANLHRNSTRSNLGLETKPLQQVTPLMVREYFESVEFQPCTSDCDGGAAADDTVKRNFKQQLPVYTVSVLSRSAPKSRYEPIRQ